jgi:hypothetical protein
MTVHVSSYDSPIHHRITLCVTRFVTDETPDELALFTAPWCPFSKIAPGLQLPLDVHTKAEQYPVIIRQQFRPPCTMDPVVVPFPGIADEVTVIRSVWKMYSSCLSIL